MTSKPMILPPPDDAPLDLGFMRLGVAAPEHRVADCAFNAERILELLPRAAAAGCQLLVLPELCLTGYSCGDLFYQSWLRVAAADALRAVRAGCRAHRTALVVGLPLTHEGRLYNAAVLVDSTGKVAGAVPKVYLPASGEFYEPRWFARGPSGSSTSGVLLDGEVVPFGTDLLFASGEALIGIELCEDLWAVKPPSLNQALAGANVLLNLSASNELLGKAEYRRELVRQQSARCLAAYAYASAGPGESSTDLVYSGHCMIAENGEVLCQTERFRFDTQLACADVDLQRLEFNRARNSSFAQAAEPPCRRVLPVMLPPFAAGAKLLRDLARQPFVPADPAQCAERCGEIIMIQATGLARRLRHIGMPKVVLGLSGGLDSTLAALVACRAYDLLREPRRILAVTMPGMGTTNRTRSNAEELAQLLGLEFRCIPIETSVRQHLADIAHPEELHDVTFENAQARERTQILMDLANQVGGLVLGTGDLSELALGWCTFNGDHMSMYHVNAGVPKTLVRYLVEWCAEALYAGRTAVVLKDICATPISPELLPANPTGDSPHRTEETVGPYELHDFFLFHFVRGGCSPAKLRRLACEAFVPRYPVADVDRWLRVFITRFFQQQFKRNAMPDGPKVGSVALSPRGDWRMPSDASAALWL